MRSAAAALLTLALVVGTSPDACGQSATVVESNQRGTSYTFANSAGFSLANNGTLSYPGPLNQLTGSPCCLSATITVNGESTTITPSLFEADTGLKIQKQGGNTLSAQLSTAVMPAQSGPNRLALQYDVVVGGVSRVAVTSSSDLQDKVDEQSLSLFSQFQPSVFP